MNQTLTSGPMTSEKDKAINKGAYETQCPVCPAGTLRKASDGGTTTLTMERDGATIVFKDVPADVCDVCGEAYIHEDVSAAVYEKAEEAVEEGVQFDVRRWKGVQNATA